MPHESETSFHSALAALLREHGLSVARAERLAASLICDYPLVRKIGVEKMASRLEDAGLEAGVATEAAFDLLAFEVLGRLSYGGTLRWMRERTEPAIALGACLRGAQARREARSGAPLEEPGQIRARILRLAIAWLR
jgi:hypothetical protein